MLKSLDGTGELSDIERRDKDMRTGAAGNRRGEVEQVNQSYCSLDYSDI